MSDFQVSQLLRVYFFWNTPDVLNTLVNYLSLKIQKELADKGLINIYLDAKEAIEMGIADKII